MTESVVLKTHVEQRVGATLFILLGAPVCDESHVLVELDRLRVLLIHSEFADVVMGDAVFEQLLADAVFTRRRVHDDRDRRTAFRAVRRRLP